MNLPVLDQPVSTAACQELADSIEGEVRFGRHIRQLYSTDASLYQVPPLGVVQPRHAQDVQETIRWCHRHGLPVLPRGG